jgi:hypothetical protein
MISLKSSASSKLTEPLLCYGPPRKIHLIWETLEWSNFDADAVQFVALSPMRHRRR